MLVARSRGQGTTLAKAGFSMAPHGSPAQFKQQNIGRLLTKIARIFNALHAWRLMKIRTIQVNKNDADKRIDKFLTKVLNNMPQSLMYKYLRTKKIKLNGKKATPDTKLCENDVITLYISDEFFFDAKDEADKYKYLQYPSNTLNQNEIVYEDDNIILVDKPQGEIVHSSLPEDLEYSSAQSTLKEPCLIDRICG